MSKRLFLSDTLILLNLVRLQKLHTKSEGMNPPFPIPKRHKHHLFSLVPLKMNPSLYFAFFLVVLPHFCLTQNDSPAIYFNQTLTPGVFSDSKSNPNQACDPGDYLCADLSGCCVRGSICCGNWCCINGASCYGGTCRVVESCPPGYFDCHNDYCCQTGSKCCGSKCCINGAVCTGGTCIRNSPGSASLNSAMTGLILAILVAISVLNS